MRLHPTSWLSRRTARLRLTVTYGALFLLSGTVVLVMIYVLVAGGPVIPFVGHTSSAAVASAVPAHGPAPPGGLGGSSGVATVTPATIVQHFGPGGRTLRKVITDQAFAQHNADVGKVLAVSWIVLAITTVLSGFLGWIVAGRVLAPLRTIATTAQTISAGNLDQRLALSGPNDEFKRLGDTLDGLLARLEASFEAQRRFVANASHELRTPLTLERTLLQVALADPDADAAALRATCEELLASGRDHERLLDALLTLASSERGLDRRWPIDLATITAAALAVPPPEIEARGLRVDTVIEGAPALGDAALIARLVANLIDNAVQHNVAGGWVELRTGVAGGAAFVSVTNLGDFVPSSELDRLFEPFQRLAAERTDAGGERHGLGLSIVRAIATAHGATLTAEARPAGGLSITVGFVPVPSEPPSGTLVLQPESVPI